MKKVRLIWALLALTAGCESAQAISEQEVSFDHKVTYRYINVLDPRERHAFVFDGANLRFFDYDLELPARYQSNENFYVAVEALGFRFFYPNNSNELDGWHYGKCSFKKIVDSPLYNEQIEQKYTNLTLVESECSDSPKIYRYLFSKYFGLQGYAVGISIKEDNGKQFVPQKVFYLFNDSDGVGLLGASK